MSWDLILKFLAILGGLGALAAIIAVLANRVEEGSALARLWAWVQRSRKEHEALKSRIKELEKHVDLLSDVVRKQMDLRNAEYDRLTQRIADLKLRADENGKRLTDTQGTVFNNGLEINALGTMQKQVDVQLESHAQTLQTFLDQIAELRKHDVELLDTSTTDLRLLDSRLRRLEGRTPEAYFGKASASDSRSSDTKGEAFYP